MVRVLRVRRRGYSRAVVEDIAPTLPAREQDFRLELATSVGIYRATVDRSGSAFGCGGGVEGAGGAGGDERVEVLGDGVVDGAAGDAEEVWRFRRVLGYERELGKLADGSDARCQFTHLSRRVD